MFSVDDLLGSGLDDFLSWAQDRGEPVPGRCAEVALALLVLRGAPLRGGLPQPAAKLLGQVLRDDLPRLVCGGPEEVAAYPRVLGLLIDHQRAAGLLNAERHRALHTAVRRAVPDYEWAVREPLGLTWPRLYGGLLRADGVQVTDQQAVRGWLTDYRSRPGRRAALGSALGASNGSAGGRVEEGWLETAVWLRQRVAIVDLCTRNAELHLYGQLQQWRADRLRAAVRALEAARRGRPPAGGRAPGGGSGAGVEALDDQDREAAADFLVDRATAAGLSAALRGDFSDLAAGAGGAADDDGLVDRLNQRRQWWQPAGPWALPAVEEVPAEQFAGLVRTSALLASAVELAEWVAQRGGLRCPPDAVDAMPAGEDAELAAARAGLSAQTAPEVWRIALAAGLLRVVDGQVVGGDAVRVWRSGSAEELLELALDALAAVVAELPRLADRAEDAGVAGDDCQILAALATDLPATLIQLYSTPKAESLARLAALMQTWVLPRWVDDARPEDYAVPAAALATRLRPPRSRPIHPDAAPLVIGTGTDDPDDSVEYQLPPNSELQRLLGIPDIDDNDRAELLALAYWQALLLDRLDALGVVRRDGDLIEVTTLGRVLLRAMLLEAGFEAPTAAGMAAVDADTLLTRMASWSRQVRLGALRTWLQARQDTDTGWKELLQAVAAGPRPYRRMIFELLGVWSPLGPARQPVEQQPVEQPNLPVPLERLEAEQSLVAALHEAIPDPAIGAYAAEALRLRGIPPADPPRSARAVLVLDRLEHLSYVINRFDRHPAEDADPDQQPQPPSTAVCAAFDAAAADWPGGPGDLLREFAAVGEPTNADILDLIGRAHPAPTVAGAARAARDRIGRGPSPATPGPGTAPQPPADSGHRQPPANRPARKRNRKHRR